MYPEKPLLRKFTEPFAPGWYVGTNEGIDKKRALLALPAKRSAFVSARISKFTFKLTKSILSRSQCMPGHRGSLECAVHQVGTGSLGGYCCQVGGNRGSAGATLYLHNADYFCHFAYLLFIFFHNSLEMRCASAT